MVVLKIKKFKFMKLLIIIFCLLSFVQAQIQMYEIDLNDLRTQANVIIVASLNKSSQEKAGSRLILYEFNIKKIIKGNILLKPLLMFRENIESARGKPPELETSVDYILFLKQEQINPLSKTILYSLLGNWQGIIPLKKSALEQRSARNILNVYGVDIYNDINSFVEALVKSQNEEKKSKTENISKKAKELMRVFEIDQAYEAIK